VLPNNLIVISVTSLMLLLLFKKTIRNSDIWRATVTPLASIIGSGFLISAPLLILSIGQYAALGMFIIVLVGYLIGSSLRYNIKYLEPLLEGSINRDYIISLENVSKLMLSIAYLVSITFYLKLLSAFLLRGMSLDLILYENILTTLLLLFITLTGRIKGLGVLESLETYSVNIKISIIIALIIGHTVFNFNLILNDQWKLNIYPHDNLFISFKKILGMLVIIQGFETSRYLGNKYPSYLRIKTMKLAQSISGVIYVIFIFTTLAAFNNVHNIEPTTVVDVCRLIAPALPYLLILAAVMSQFSAAVADTIGSGGLLTEFFKFKISLRTSYVFVGFLAIILTWTTNIYAIVTYASKAFAIYYAIQLFISCNLLVRQGITLRSTSKIICYVCMILLMALVVLIGIPVKGD
jgi:hypothetical protein